MLKIDMWYGHHVSAADRLDCTFYPNDGVYRGNLYSGPRPIGDYTATDSAELADYFRNLGFNWRWE